MNIEIKCKPFVKWVGGKGQLLPEINKIYPIELEKTINKYAEIFVGGGAVLFDILNKYHLDEVYISDKNLELINTYKSIRDNVDILIKSLFSLNVSIKEFIISYSINGSSP